jgi:transposase
MAPKSHPDRDTIATFRRVSRAGFEAAFLWVLLPPAKELIADRGYDSARFRAQHARRGIAACIPAKKNRKQLTPYDKALYRQRHCIETIFARLKDW